MANETVLFKRGDSATITSTPVTDGQILFDTSGNGKMYLDNGTDRLEMGGAITVDASLSKTSTNAIQNKAVTGNILNSLAEVSAATQQNTIAGALALKEVNSSLVKLKNQSVTFTNGSATFSHESIKTTSIIFVQAVSLNGRGNMAMTIDIDEIVNNGSFVLKAYDAYNNKNYSGTILVNILICN